jgi:hypothetical protein
MSSSDPPQLRLPFPHSASTFKRSFDQFGFDLGSPLDPTAVASSSGTDEHRPGPSNGNRNKRARRNSVTPNSSEQTYSMDSSPGSSSSHTMSSGSSNHAAADHRDAPPAVAVTRYPQTPESDPVFPSGLGGEFGHPSSGLFDSRPFEAPHAEPPTAPVWSNPLSSTNSSSDQNDQFRISMERYHAFDSQISSIRARPSQLSFRVHPNPPTLPPLTPSSAIEHSHSHISPVVSLPSVESLSYTSTSAQASTPLMALHSDMSPLRFEEFGELREMMGFYHQRNPNFPNIDRPIVRRRHQSPPSPDNSERPRINSSFGRSPPRHITENVSRNPSMQSWPSDRRGPFGYPEFTSSEESPYGSDRPMPSPWFNEENATPRQSIPTSRVQRDTSVSRQVPWRTSLPSNDASEDRFLSYLSFLHRPAVTATTGEVTQPGEYLR